MAWPTQRLIVAEQLVATRHSGFGEGGEGEEARFEQEPGCFVLSDSTAGQDAGVTFRHVAKCAMRSTRFQVYWLDRVLCVLLCSYRIGRSTLYQYSKEMQRTIPGRK